MFFWRVVLLLLIPAAANAFSLSPMSQTIRLDEKIKQVQFFVSNPTQQPMPIVVKALARQQNLDGSEVTPETSLLEVFPPQLIIPPKEKRSIRVTWKGTQKPTQELAFRLIAEQIPLDVNQKQNKQAGIKMLLKYIAALYVDPGKTTADVVLKEFHPSDKGLRLTLENRGSKHAPLLKPKLTFTKDKQTISLSDDQLKGLIGENILAGTTRQFLLPAIPALTQEFSGQLKLD